MNHPFISSALAAGLLAGPAFGAAPADGAPPATLPASRPAATQPRIARFQPGIRLNWIERQVEVDATVILRDAPIELFACSPGQREHEAIVRIEARPTHLFHALGLIGLTPGKPARFDPATERPLPATGDPVEVLVRYTTDGQTRLDPIETWMKEAEKDGPLPPQPWVFAGSMPGEDGNLLTDTEGTVISVVDFPTSLIALPDNHSDRNTELWLRPRTERIPAVGTKCELIVRAAPVRLRLEQTGRLRLAGKLVSRGELAQAITDGVKDNPALRVALTIEAGTDALEERSLLQLLKNLKIGEDRLVAARETPQNAR